MSTYFDSRNKLYEDPFGAVPCGSAVLFCLRPEEGDAVTRCVFLAHEEFADRWTETELPAVEEDGRTVFRGTYTAPAEGELVWYHFRLYWADGGESCYDKTGHTSWNKVDPWQLTVYDAAQKTPDWFGRGVTYQIFPDRFYRAKHRYAAGLVGSRSLHEHWDEPMDYRPNEHGEITCSDFFGGDLLGITQKLDYLAALGVTTLYLCPIFEAASNHRYDTADYLRIDPLLGDEADFQTLCREAKARGIRVLLDGVFNHTGSRSRYFNADGFYGGIGAAQSQASHYFPWYSFTNYPAEYDAWWGIKTLPAVNESRESYVNFIYRSSASVVRHWLRAGASGWRLDVADELPDEFITGIRSAIEEETPDGFLLGEVWEDGSNKISYSRRRKYLLGSETHGLMNYPFRTALLAFLQGGDASDFVETMETLRENYAAPAFYSALNFLSTHDTPRLLTLLGHEGAAPKSRDERAAYRLSPAEYARGIALLKLAALMMYSFPGSPTIFYGDEAGMQGYEDPFNRGTYPWGHEDKGLIEYFAKLGSLRKTHESLQSGTIAYPYASGAVLAILRQSKCDSCLCVVNAGSSVAQLSLPWEKASAADALSNQQFPCADGKLSLMLPPFSGLLLT